MCCVLICYPYLPEALRDIIENISYDILLKPCNSFEEAFALAEQHSKALSALPPLDIDTILREVSL